MARIENHKHTIESAFKECFYIVPDYQREYVWTEKQVGRLLEDINEQLETNNAEYFIGNVLVSETKERGHFDIIDGQQRLTTLFLVLCALRVLFKGTKHDLLMSRLITDYDTDHLYEEVKNNNKLDPRYENASEVIKKIVETNDDPQATKASVQSSGIAIYGSVENILNAYEFIYHFLSDNYDNESKLKKYWAYLATNVIFFQISADVSSALKIFETINERGVSLNPMDLLKNLLFKQIPPENFSKLKDEWKKITSPLEKNKEKPLRFLRYFLMASYKIDNDRKDSIVREDEIYDWFSKQENGNLTRYQSDPLGFVRQIISSVNLYIDFSESRGNDGKSSIVMDSLRKLTGEAFSLHYILLLAAASLPKSLFDQFVSQLESFLFYYIFTKTPTKELERSFSVWADDIRKITLIQNHSTQKDELNKFIIDRFKQSMLRKAAELNDAMKRLTLYSTQRYRMRYLLAKLTQYVDAGFQGQKDCGSLDHYFKLEIEHILPDNPKDELRSLWQKNNPDLEYDEFKNRFGNLTLLEKPINIVAGNDFYTKKKPQYALSGNYLTRSITSLAEIGQNTSITRINEKLSSFDNWMAKDIEKRQALLIGLIYDIWKISEII